MSSEAGMQGFFFDVDLDFFTVSWETYTFPFTREIYDGEFLQFCQSDYADDIRPVDLVRSLAESASVITVATEPQFCDGAGKAEKILDDVNRVFFEDQINTEELAVDYLPLYPSE